MKFRIGFWMLFGLLLAANHAVAQAQPRPRQASPPNPAGPMIPPRAATQPIQGPDQPVVPQIPTLQRVAPPQAPRAPFELTLQQQAELDQALGTWELKNSRIKQFECNFTRWEYDATFGDADKPKSQDDGKIKYAAPDKGMFRVDGVNAEHWICDGKAIFEYNGDKKQVIQYNLPPELQGKAITNGPLPFLFGAEAARLKQRYFLRLITPADVKEQIWLEAWPRFQQDAADFSRAWLILSTKDMRPLGLQVYATNGQSRKAFQFRDIVINDPLSFLKGDPFRPMTPLGWTRIVDEASSSPRVTQQPDASRR